MTRFERRYQKHLYEEGSRIGDVEVVVEVDTNHESHDSDAIDVMNHVGEAIDEALAEVEDDA